MTRSANEVRNQSIVTQFYMFFLVFGSWFAAIARSNVRIGRCWIWQRWVTAFGTMALVKTGYVPLSWPPSACSASVELQIAADWAHVLQADVFVIAVFGCLWQVLLQKST